MFTKSLLLKGGGLPSAHLGWLLGSNFSKRLRVAMCLEAGWRTQNSIHMQSTSSVQDVAFFGEMGVG